MDTYKVCSSMILSIFTELPNEHHNCKWFSLPSKRRYTPGNYFQHLKGTIMHSFMCFRYVYYFIGGFPGGSEVKASASNAGDLGSIPGWGRSLGEGNDKPPQYPCLGNHMNRGAWWATVHEVTRVSCDLTTKTIMCGRHPSCGCSQVGLVRMFPVS